MSGQIIELIIFAGIALFIISKLISTLGNTSEEDPAKGSFFGERDVKDVTESAKAENIIRPIFSLKKPRIFNVAGLVVPENQTQVESGLAEVLAKIPNFDVNKFLKSAKVAFKMILETSQDSDSEFEELVDKRYLESFKNRVQNYGNCTEHFAMLSAQISEIYSFGNNVFIKVLFSGQNITDKVDYLHEEWTFTKSTLDNSPRWYLTNVDQS
jgi:predicted lipid-binding transport protein (Tim44 family)